MIEVYKLRKKFGAFTAVDDISFNVNKGEVLGFLGPNGAGKSTTMKMITGFLNPDGGTVTVCGADVAKSPLEVKKSIGYLPEGAPAYDDMTVLGFLRFIANIRGYHGAEKNKRIENAIQKTNLESVVHKTIETLSKGFKRRVGLAQAILHNPPVLVMDEPTDGLDPNQKHEVRLLIKEMAKEKAIIISTHILEEVDAICDRAIIIADGSIKFDGTPKELEAMSEHHNMIHLTLDGYPSLNVEKLLRELSSVVRVVHESSAEEKTNYQIFSDNTSEAIKQITTLAQSQAWVVDQLFIDKGRLEDVFRRLTTNDVNNKGQEHA